MIRTCLGTGPERHAAIASVYSAIHRGIVLDTYTAWVAYFPGLIEVLKSLFGRVALPQFSIDELLEWRQRFEPTGDESLMTIGYAEGRYFREEIPAERLAQAVVTINTGIETLRHQLEILPAAAPLGPSALEKALLGLVQHGFLDPVYISVTEDLLLVSEDLHYRNLARQLYGQDGVWLQVALMVAHDIGRMEPAAYAHAICDLAIQRHDHVTLRAATLVALAVEEQNDSSGSHGGTRAGLLAQDHARGGLPPQLLCRRQAIRGLPSRGAEPGGVSFGTAEYEANADALGTSYR